MNKNFGAAVANDNGRDIYPITNSPAQNAYLKALRHFIRVEEEAASCALNSARHEVLRANTVEGETRHWSSLTTGDLQLIHNDLTLAKFQLLYGDYKSVARTPWNTMPVVVNMVGEHLKALGTEQDLYEYSLFLQKHAPAAQKAHALVID